MKAIWMLEALDRCGIKAGKWGMIPMGKDYPFMEMFGDEPMGEFVPGRYVYVDAAHISEEAFEYLTNAADHTLFGPDPENQCTMLFRIELSDDEQVASQKKCHDELMRDPNFAQVYNIINN